MRLMLLEDDELLGDGLSAYLAGEGHKVDWFTRLAEIPMLQLGIYDALLVDWNLPDGSGLDWVADLRRRSVSTPVVVLTARDAAGDRILGFDAGADVYLIKPIDPGELSARLRAIERRIANLSGTDAAVQRVGEVDVDIAARTVRHRGRQVELTTREWAVLEALLTRVGRVVEKSTLEAFALGNQGEAASNALEVHVCNLRRKLGRDLIETVRGLGYRIDP